MGLFDKIFGGKQEEYPLLDPASPLNEHLGTVKSPLETLARQVSDRIEIVPCRDKAYVFVGKPPKDFGVAWIENGKVNNFRKLVEDRKIPMPRYQLLSDRLREAYEKSSGASRFVTSLGNRKVFVTESETLGKEVQEVIGEASA